MKQYSIEEFFRNAPTAAYQISPNGQHISYMSPYKDRMNLFVVPTDGETEPRQLTFETERSIQGYMWAGNDRLLFAKDTAGDENYRLYGISIDGSDEICYTPFEGVRAGILDDLEDVPDGHIRAVTAIVDGVNTQLLYRDTDEEPFRPVLTTNFKESVNFLLFTPDNRNVYAATNLGRDKTALVEMNPATAEEVCLLYEDEKYDVSSLNYSRRRKKLLSCYCTGHREPVRHFFDEEEQAFRERLRALFPGKRVAMADVDKAEEHYILYVGSDRTRGAYYYYDDTTDTLRKLADLAPQLAEADMAEMHAVTYTSRDGLRIEAYLSLPSGLTPETARALPVVVNPHGGPWARDSWGFSSETQFLCNRGYAVFQMNFRGSTGYGRRFLEAGYGQWGLRMQDDITDGVDWLISQGIADPKRVAIYGGSYGGYAALAGVAFTPEKYACAVDYVGVSNLLTFLATIPPYWKPMLQMMYEQVGNPETDRERLEATSPALHADRIRVPLFVAQGAHDPRVNKAESDQMVAALRQRGVPVEYMVKENEGHGFQNQENRFDFYRAMERFLAAHLQ